MNDNFVLILPAQSGIHCRFHVNSDDIKDLKELIKKLLKNEPLINVDVLQKKENLKLAAFCGLQSSQKPQNLLAKKYINSVTPIFGDVVVVGTSDCSKLRTLSDHNGECDFFLD